MSINKRVGLGFTLGADATGGTTYVVLGAIVDGFDGPGAEAELPDTTVLSDTFRTFGKSHVDGGMVEFSIAYDPDEATTTVVLNNMLASTSQTAPHWQITYPAGSTGAGTVTTENFKGFLKSIKRKVKVKDFVVADIVVKVSGDPGYTHS